jgi:N-terminal half of MaoC dehydratase
MAIDRQFIGFRLPPFTVTVDGGRLRQFAAAIGVGAGGHSDEHPPPTYLKVIEGEGNSSREILAALGVNLTRVLHAEQEFEYHAAFRSGDALTVERVVSDIYERKGGQLEFIVVDSVIRHAGGALVARTQQVILVRNPAAAAAA